MRVWPGLPSPLGATWDGEGVNFAVFSEHGTGVDLCLFDAADPGAETQRIALGERTNGVWHGYLPEARPGSLYGYRVDGPHDPEQGHRFNPSKLLVDPYARALLGDVQHEDAIFGYRIGDAAADLSRDDADSAAFVPKSIVVDRAYDWADDSSPRTPWSRTVIYECHVKGMTALHPDVPEHLRGTYLGLASDPVIEHLLGLGVTAIELMPVHQSTSDRGLVERGLSNYWGYDSLSFFAPDARFATGDAGEQVGEFRSMVKAFHRAGIEVILDVVYNHTCEGSELGPTLSLRGIDNASYYRLRADGRRYYEDTTGCGNSLDARHPHVLQLILDSLRYWVTEMHVDGFRFDLAPTLARDISGFDPNASFFATIQQDPVLVDLKLIAEPWDLGDEGYRLGEFPPGWAEWNGKYRDTVRKFWRGDPGRRGKLASRLAGSSDLFGKHDRGPFASVNFVTCHDGMTLADLVSYEREHNEANGSGEDDGAHDSLSRNWGAEGPSDRPAVQRMRWRTMRNMIATVAFSQGVPMLSHGDEVARSQRGNNNGYCHDSELGWVDWNLDDDSREFLEFVRRVFAIRRDNPVFRRRRFFSEEARADGMRDISWLRPDGAEMTHEDWQETDRCVLGMMICGQASDEVDERRRTSRGETLLLLLNGGQSARRFELPALKGSDGWREQVNTAGAPVEGARAHSNVDLAPHSLILLVVEDSP